MTAFALKKDNLYQELRQEILSGHYAPESRLPNELDFCRQLGVGKVTLRSALERLEKDGLVICQRGGMLQPDSGGNHSGKRNRTAAQLYPAGNRSHGSGNGI